MKYIFSKIVLTITTVLLFSSCNKFLEVTPSNVQSVSTYEDVKTLLGGHLRMYTALSTATLSKTTIPYLDKDNYGRFYFYTDDYKPEFYLDHATGRNYRVEFYNSLNWDNQKQSENLWSQHYANIGFYNMVIDELNALKTPATKDQKQIILGEAKLLRAWSLFKLMQYYSPYKIDRLGIPINLSSNNVNAYEAKRLTQTQGYKIIIDELKEVLTYTATPSTTYNIFYDKNIVKALLAQVLHYKAGSGAAAADDYTQAIDYAKDVLQNSGLSIVYRKKMPILPITVGLKKDRDYALISDVRTNTLLNQFAISSGTESAGYYQYGSDALLSLFTDNDKRKADNFIFNPDKNSYGNTKFWGIGSHYQAIFFSTAELYLIIAESYARLNDVPNATTWLQNFQTSRYNNYTGYTGTNILQDILNERRKEFCFEYDMRWVDLTRLQTGFDHAAINNPALVKYTLKDGDAKFCLPIPLAGELENVKYEQNPGW